MSTLKISLSCEPTRTRKKDWAPLVQWASGSSVFLVQILTLLVLWESWKEHQEQACYITCPEKCAESYILNVYLSFGRVNTNSCTCLTDKITCLGWVDKVFFAPCKGGNYKATVQVKVMDFINWSWYKGNIQCKYHEKQISCNVLPVEWYTLITSVDKIQC